MNAALDIDKPEKTKRSKRTTDMTTGSPAKLCFILPCLFYRKYTSAVLQSG